MTLIWVALVWAHVPHQVVGSAALPPDLAPTAPWYVLVTAFGPHLLRSDNGGITFESLGGEALGDDPRQIDVLDDGTLVVLGREAVWRSTVPGEWEYTELPAAIDGFSVVVNDVVLWGPDGVWAGPVEGPFDLERSANVRLLSGRNTLALWGDNDEVALGVNGTWTPAGALASLSALHFDGETAVAGTLDGSTWLWSDETAAWETCAALPSQGQPHGEAVQITMDEGFIYVATGISGVYVSADACQTWEARGAEVPVDYEVSGGPALSTQTFVALRAAGERLALAGWYGLTTSTNAGEAWQQSNIVRPDLTRGLAVAGNGVPKLWAGSYSGAALLSTNGGAEWTAPNHGVYNLNVQDILLDPRKPAWVYALFDHNGFVSHDGGKSWFRPDLPADIDRYSLGPNPGEIYASAGGVYFSEDAGTTWVVVEGLGPDEAPGDPRFLTTLASGTRCFVANEAQELWCDEGGNANWHFRVSLNGIDHPGLVAWPPESPDRVLALAGSAVVTHLPDTNEGWTNDVLDLDSLVALAVADSGELFAATAAGRVMRSNDAGQSWGTLGDAFAAPIHVLLPRPRFAEMSDLLVATGDGIFVMANAHGAEASTEALAPVEWFDDASTFATRNGCSAARKGANGSFDTLSTFGPGCSWRIMARGTTLQVFGVSDGLSSVNVVVDGTVLATIGNERIAPAGLAAELSLSAGWHVVELIGVEGTGFQLDAVVLRAEGTVLKAIPDENAGKVDEACGCNAADGWPTDSPFGIATWLLAAVWAKRARNLRVSRANLPEST